MFICCKHLYMRITALDSLKYSEVIVLLGITT